jgi:uridine phosphorylase
MFTSGCKLIVSITSAGQIEAIQNPPHFILIEKALRDEGTSYHYLPDSEYSHIDDALLKMLGDSLTQGPVPVYKGATWTTDAPFRETASAIARCRKLGILAVEMEAAALYAFAEARNNPVICLAHFTNQMASFVGDFEKGAANGSQDALHLLASIVNVWHRKFG